MPSHIRRPGLAPLAALFHVVALAHVVAFAVTLLSPAGPRAQSAQSSREARRSDLETRQRALRNLERLKRTPPERAVERRPAYREVAEDFEQLQLSNYNLTGVAVEGPALDYARIREEAAEVRKRAARLRVHLSLPDPDKGQKRKKDAETVHPAELKSAVASLDALVNSFVWNPVFQRPDVVDVEQSSKASRDLDAIIKLSEQIRECAESLRKGGAKKP